MITDFRLNVFIAVARSLSFTKAASMLNVSQPAVSKHIKELEGDFGEPLFNRKGNSISLTEKGREIIPIVETILEGYGVLNDTVIKEGNSFEGLLHIGASTTIAQYVLPSILAKFSSEYPNIKLSVISANSDEVVKLLQDKTIDLALIEGDTTINSLHYSLIADDEIVLVSSKKSRKLLSIDDLTKIPLLIREEGSGSLSVILSALKNIGIARKNLNIKMQLGSSEAIIRYIISSNDYAFISILVAREHIERGELYINEIEDFKITRNFRYVSLHGQNSRLVNLFKSFFDRHYNF